MVLKVSETFLSIQGESSYAGLPCFFIRLTGCNLRCNYCDTSYAWEEGTKKKKEELLREALNSKVKLVEVTGGEPLLQTGSLELIKALLDRKLKVLVETNGSQDISQVDERAVIILDIKTPGSGMSEHMDLDNLKRLKEKDEVKFVITNRNDYEWTKSILKDFSLSGGRVLLSPAYGMLEPVQLVEWILEDRLDVRLNIQIHKLLFGNVRGK